MLHRAEKLAAWSFGQLQARLGKAQFTSSRITSFLEKISHCVFHTGVAAAAFSSISQHNGQGSGVSVLVIYVHSEHTNSPDQCNWAWKTGIPGRWGSVCRTT
jgi:hypothetical protein